MAHLTHLVSRNNGSVLSKTADKNLPILSNFIRHVPLRIILVSSENAASLQHDYKLLSFNPLISYGIFSYLLNNFDSVNGNE